MFVPGTHWTPARTPFSAWAEKMRQQSRHRHRHHHHRHHRHHHHRYHHHRYHHHHHVIVTITHTTTRAACVAPNNHGCRVKASEAAGGKILWERSCCSEASCQEQVSHNSVFETLLKDSFHSRAVHRAKSLLRGKYRLGNHDAEDKLTTMVPQMAAHCTPPFEVPADKLLDQSGQV